MVLFAILTVLKNCAADLGHQTVMEALLPSYFFKVTGPKSYAHSVNVVLLDDHAAWSMAVTSTGELIRDLDGKMPDKAEIIATVKDAIGRLVVTLRVTGDKGPGWR